MKRAPLNFNAMKAQKDDIAPVVAEAAPQEPKGRGRPAKRSKETVTYGMTLRIDGKTRKALRRAAELATDERERSGLGGVVSAHDIILEALLKELEARGVKVR